MTFAKGIANGMPVGATIATPEVAASMDCLSLSTFGGNPVSMAATNASFDVMEKHDLPARVERQGTALRERLDALAERYDFIGEVRGMGLMQAIEFVEDPKTKEPSPKRANQLMEAAKAEGLLLGKGGRWGNVMRIAPPMLIEDDALAEGSDRLERAIATLS